MRQCQRILRPPSEARRKARNWLPSSEAFQRSITSCSIVPGISGPQVLWCSILATTRQEPAVFSERPTDVSYLPVPGTLQRAGVGNPPCIPAGVRGESGKMKAQSWREAQLERWRLTRSVLMGSYTCRRYVTGFYFSVFVFPGLGVQKPLTAALRALSIVDVLLKIVQHSLIEHERGSWFAASSTIALTISQIAKCSRIPSADFSQSQVGLAHLGHTVIFA